MYTEKELKRVEAVSVETYKIKSEMHKDAARLVTRWGKNLINFQGLDVKCYIEVEGKGRLSVGISYPEEFGATISVEYEEGVVGFRKGTTGLVTKEKAPRQMDILLLQGKLIEHGDKLQEGLDKILSEYSKRVKPVEEKQRKLQNENPGLVKAYYDSAMYYERITGRK